MNELLRRRWGCLQWGIVFGVALLLILLLIPTLNVTAKIGEQSKAIMNCKTIILSLKQYGKDRQGIYPDSVPAYFEGQRPTANASFRGLFIEGIITDEQIFACPKSVYAPDGVIGAPPDFLDALKAGENHWMMLKGQTDYTAGNIPIVFENTIKPEWPLRWNTIQAGRSVRGIVWANGSIIVGLNEGSIKLEKVRPDGMVEVKLPQGFGASEVLDIEEK
ncbi:hypothetical protein [Prosthecobacter sp.]|jgi:hypothetical protein|uniref:hypothetical protein n=1 Tax=Prosthecobacter sp. TaxID=1965333 RepID=UPI00378414DD